MRAAASSMLLLGPGRVTGNTVGVVAVRPSAAPWGAHKMGRKTGALRPLSARLT